MVGSCGLCLFCLWDRSFPSVPWAVEPSLSCFCDLRGLESNGAPSPAPWQFTQAAFVECLTRCMVSSLVSDQLCVLGQVSGPLRGVVFEMEVRINELAVAHLLHHL